MNLNQNRNYWSTAGPAVALAVERKHYFKELIGLCASIPRDEVFYILSMELCRWLDKDESVETFVEWVSCSATGTTAEKALILDKLSPGSKLFFYSGMVELGAMLDTVCEKYAGQEQTPFGRLTRWLLELEGIVHLSTCLYNKYPKGFAFYLAVYSYDNLATICKTRSALNFFYEVYKGSCYGNDPVTDSATRSEFADYLKEEYRTRLLPFLKSHYMNPKPKALASLLFALNDLELLTINLTENQTELHQALGFFGSVGTRQALNTNITKLNSASDRDHRAIEKHRKLINEHIAQL